MTLTAAAPLPLSGRTTVLLWGPAAAHWRGREGGTAGAVLDAAVRALGAPGYRWPIPAPERGAREALARAGTALNTAVRQRYVRGEAVGAIAGAAGEVAARAAAVCAGGPTAAGSPAVLCVGRLDRLVHVRMDPRMLAAMHDAAAANGMRLGVWVRDGVAAALGEHQARRAAEATREARTVVGRVAGLLVQAGTVAVDDAERQAVGAAEDALSVAAERLRWWGSAR